MKLFGGGSMFTPDSYKSTTINISKSNVSKGLQLLKDHGFNIKTSDLGGNCYRKIYLELWTGDVWSNRSNSYDS
ncbi:MAG: hypothetical protein P1U57_08330 [Oleibacter sp.]|nr:hypothetical protein [Thalassolituus sp.]